MIGILRALNESAGRLFRATTNTDKTTLITKVSKKAKIRKRYNQVPNLTQGTTWKSDKNTSKHHTQESQDVSPFQAGDNKATINSHIQCLSLCLLMW